MSKANKNFQPHWRPNFVNVSGLPDIKVIRTNFIINFVAAVLLFIVGIYVVQREYQAYALGKRIEDMEQNIREAEAGDAANLKLSQEFRDLTAHVAELEKFYATPITPHVLLTEITKVRPEELIFNQISLVEFATKQGGKQVVAYRINLSGAVRSLTVLDEFKDKLYNWKLVNVEGYDVDVDEALQGRDAKTGIFPYTLEITLRPAKSDTGGADS